MVSPLPSISEVVPRIFIGNIRCAFKEATYKDNNIKAVLSLTRRRYHAAVWERVMFNTYIKAGRHLWIQCRDSELHNLIQHMPQIVAFMSDMTRQLSTQQQLEEKPPAILVHCEAGRSRSAAGVMAYLMALQKEPDATKVLQQLQKSRKVQPNPGFMDQLHLWGAIHFVLHNADGEPKQEYTQWEASLKAALKAKGLTGEESMDRENIV